MNPLDRRHFIKGGLAVGAGAALNPLSKLAATEMAQTTQQSPEGFFSLGERKDHWWLTTPEGKPFFTMGINHIDPASLRYPENVHIWKNKYGGSSIQWIEESVAPNLKSWGFNTVGWVQEVTVPPMAALPCLYRRRV